LVDAVANQPLPENAVKKLERFKIADPQYVLSTSPAQTINDMENLILQGIGGHEILSLARRDLIDGKNISYGIVSSLQKLFEEYNPKTIVSLENTSFSYFKSLGVSFEKFLPSEKALDGIAPGLKNPISIDSQENITIYVSNVKDFHEVEVQSLTSEEVLRDIIYLGDN
jgi:hypothetical protein